MYSSNNKPVSICPLACFLIHTKFVLLLNFTTLSFFLKSEESKPVPKISPAKTAEPSVNLLGLGECENDSSLAPPPEDILIGGFSESRMCCGKVLTNILCTELG